MKIQAICEIILIVSNYYNRVDIDFNHAERIVYLWANKKFLMKINYDY